MCYANRPHYILAPRLLLRLLNKKRRLPPPQRRTAGWAWRRRTWVAQSSMNKMQILVQEARNCTTYRNEKKNNGREIN